MRATQLYLSISKSREDRPVPRTQSVHESTFLSLKKKKKSKCKWKQNVESNIELGKVLRVDAPEWFYNPGD